jgi:hypothetical protein
MQQLSRNSLDKFNKSCITFHQKSNKISFAFFWIFYDFLRILQDSAKQQNYSRFKFSAKPLELFRIHTNALTLH